MATQDSIEKRGKKIFVTFQGETHSLREWAKSIGISSGLLWDRLRRGWSLQRALSNMDGRTTKINNRNITFNGVTKHVGQWSREVGIATSTICARLEKGWTAKEALTTSPTSKSHCRYEGLTSKYKTEYHAWIGMIKRCQSPKHSAWKNYGGRGIQVCARWLGDDGFLNFLTDMGSKPSPRLTLDRIDNDENYEPDNCRWATMTQQSRNKRTNVFLRFKGESRCINEWAEIIGVPPTRILQRLDTGLTAAEALTLTTKDIRDRKLIRLSYDGQNLTIAQWAERLGISRGLIESRIARGWPIARILSPQDGRATRTRKGRDDGY